MKRRRLIIWGLGYLVVGDDGKYGLDRFIYEYFLKVSAGVDELEVLLPIPDGGGDLPRYDEFKVTYYSNGRAGVLKSGFLLLVKAFCRDLYIFMPAGSRIAPYVPGYKLVANSLSIYLADDPFALVGKNRLSSVPLMDKLYTGLCNMYLRLADRIIARGRYLVSLASRKNAAVYLTSPITDVKCFHHIRDFSPDRRTLKIMTMSRLAWVKGYQSLLDACLVLIGRLEGWKVELYIAGDGPDRKEIEEYARRIGLCGQVHFLGWLSTKAEKESLWGSVDVHVLPTITTEGVPRCIDESILHGVPTIASTVGGIPLEYSNGEVSLFAPGDVSGLADRIFEMTDVDLRQQLLLRAEARKKTLLEMGPAGEQHVDIIFQSDRKGSACS